MSEFARPFRLHLTDGRIWHGVEFPSGHAALNHPEDDMSGAFTVAMSVEHLLGNLHPLHPMHGAHVEWAEGDES